MSLTPFLTTLLCVCVLMGGVVQCADVVPTPGSEFAQIRKAQFTLYNPDHSTLIHEYKGVVGPLLDQMLALQENGKDMSCSYQLYQSIHYLMHYEDKWEHVQALILEFEDSLRSTDQAWAAGQDEEGGYWGKCAAIWDVKIATTTEALAAAWESNITVEYPLKFLDNSPLGNEDDMLEYFTDLFLSDIAADGVDRRGEINGALTFVAQVCFKSGYLHYVQTQTTGWEISQQYCNKLHAFIKSIQNPSGYWGASYKDTDVNGSDITRTTDDLSISFHLINYLHGNIDRWPVAMRTTLSMRNEPYPWGWAEINDTVVLGDNSHNNYDVVTIMKYGWPSLTPDDADLESELIACIKQFTDFQLGHDIMYVNQTTNMHQYNCTGDAQGDSPGECYYFAQAFFDVSGYFNTANRFYHNPSDTDTYTHTAVCCDLYASFVDLNITSGIGLAVYERFQNTCPDC